jgi:hypothetical protein
LKVTRDGRQIKVDVVSDGEGLVSHVGSTLLARVADKTGLTRALSRELASLKQRRGASRRSSLTSPAGSPPSSASTAVEHASRITSATTRTPGCATCRSKTLSTTASGSRSCESHTTSSAGPSDYYSQASSPGVSPSDCATSCCRSPPGSRSTPARQHCEYKQAGPGPTISPSRSSASTRSRHPRPDHQPRDDQPHPRGNAPREACQHTPSNRREPPATQKHPQPDPPPQPQPAPPPTTPPNTHITPPPARSGLAIPIIPPTRRSAQSRRHRLSWFGSAVRLPDAFTLWGT